MQQPTAEYREDAASQGVCPVFRPGEDDWAYGWSSLAANVAASFAFIGHAIAATSTAVRHVASWVGSELSAKHTSTIVKPKKVA